MSLSEGIGSSGDDKDDDDDDDGDDDLAAERAMGRRDLTDDSFLIPFDVVTPFFLNRPPVLCSR